MARHDHRQAKGQDRHDGAAHGNTYIDDEARFRRSFVPQRDEQTEYLLRLRGANPYNIGKNLAVAEKVGSRHFYGDERRHPDYPRYSNAFIGDKYNETEAGI